MHIPCHLHSRLVLSLLLAIGCIGPTSAPTSAMPPADSEASVLQRDEAQRLGKALRITNSIAMNLVLIPSGKFTMGSPKDELGRQPDEHQLTVTLTRPFYMSETEVTQEQWIALMDKNPSFVEGDNHPVETVNWIEAVEFCRKLSEKEGVTYRLPTEAEWEYACRAGTTTPYNTGRTLGTNQANFNGQIGRREIGRRETGRREIRESEKGEFRDETTEVRAFSLPNTWGLYDMHGNVWEWCADWYGAYPKDNMVDPKGPSKGTLRVVRGGCWVTARTICRSAARGKTNPDHWNFNFGFRVVRDVSRRR